MLKYHKSFQNYTYFYDAYAILKSHIPHGHGNIYGFEYFVKYIVHQFTSVFILEVLVHQLQCFLEEKIGKLWDFQTQCGEMTSS